MKNELHDLTHQVLHSLKELDYVHPADIPNIDLYVDQVTSFLDRELYSVKRSADEKSLTKTMINNYTKNHVLPSPDKKKYSRDHLLLLIFIYYMKSFLSMKDIQRILSPVTERYFGQEDDFSIYEIYEHLVGMESDMASMLVRDIISKYKKSQSVFADAPDEDQALLQRFALICALSFDVFMKKMVIEKLIDFSDPESAGETE